jgi:hypothetical protein
MASCLQRAARKLRMQIYLSNDSVDEQFSARTWGLTAKHELEEAYAVRSQLT